MKNVMIYVGPNKKFSDEDEVLAKIQIDNSLDLGWKRDDILLFTDFEYEYNGVKARVFKDIPYYDFDLAASKIPVLIYLIEKGEIDNSQLYWVHDFDAYENYSIKEEELGFDGYDLALPHYYYKPEWVMSNFFFKKSSEDILRLLDKTVIERPRTSRNNEKTITWLIKHERVDINRLKKLNATYNIAKRYIPRIYPLAEKPLKVLHFRPSDKDALMTETALDIFMYGKNRLKIRLMSDRLIKIFRHNGIK